MPNLNFNLPPGTTWRDTDCADMPTREELEQMAAEEAERDLDHERAMG